MIYRLTNSHHSPIGVYDANGEVRVVQPGQSLDVDLTEGEAAAIINGQGPLKATRVRAEIREEVAIAEASDDDGEAPKGNKRGRKGRGAAAAG